MTRLMLAVLAAILVAGLLAGALPGSARGQSTLLQETTRATYVNVVVQLNDVAPSSHQLRPRLVSLNSFTV